MGIADMQDNILDHRAMVPGEWAMSVNSLPDVGFKELAIRAARPNGKVCYSTIGRIRGLGYKIRPDDLEDGHSNILFPEMPTEPELRVLREEFTRPVRNVGRPDIGPPLTGGP